MKSPKPLVAGNWKMNGLKAAQAELIALIEMLAAAPAGCEVLICPPFTLIPRFAEVAAGSAVAIGGQDCHAAPNGAHTGDIAAEMLADAGASHVIIGHSERRADHGEDDAIVEAKARAAIRAGLAAIICIGETQGQRDAGHALAVIEAQLAGSVPAAATPENTVIAYEPVWAIGSGRTPSPGDIAQVHGAIRRLLSARFGAAGDAFRLLYGGSVKPANAAALLSAGDVDGALVGGASLKARELDGIIDAYR